MKYSTPSSVGGRFPQYSKAVLLKTIPAYAYISVSHSGSLASTPKAGASVPDVTSDVKMFIRLYQPSDELVVEYLNDGTIRRGKSYMNTLGSLEIMSQVSNIRINVIGVQQCLRYMEHYTAFILIVLSLLSNVSVDDEIK